MDEESKLKLIFELYKDKPLISSRIFRGKVEKKFKLKDTRDLYARIVKYQNEKYGFVLESGLQTGSLRKEDFEKKKQSLYKQKYDFRNQEWHRENRRIREKEQNVL